MDPDKRVEYGNRKEKIEYEIIYHLNGIKRSFLEEISPHHDTVHGEDILKGGSHRKGPVSGPPGEELQEDLCRFHGFMGEPKITLLP